MSDDTDDDGGIDPTTERVVVTTGGYRSGSRTRGGEESGSDSDGRPGRLGSFVDSLQARFQQSVETESRLPSFGIHRGGVHKIRPAKDLSEYREIPGDTPIVRKALTDFVADVSEPGYRIETDDDVVRDYLEEWCSQAAIVGGEKHNDLLPFVRMFLYEKYRGGDGLAEHVREDPEDVGSPITGLHLLNPAALAFITYDEKNILVDPEPTRDVNAPETDRGESAAYSHYRSEALVGSEKEATHLSLNDVTRSSLDVGAGEIRGNPVTGTIADDVAGFKNILRDKEQAIKSKAYGLWQLAFGRDTLEYSERDQETGELTEVTEIIEWDDTEQEEIAKALEKDMGPGSILTHDGVIELGRIEGEVPDLIDDLHFYVSNIVSPLPTPLYVVGFEQDINQFVTERQDQRYEKLIGEEREELERVFSDTLRRVVETNLVEGDHDTEFADGSVTEVPEDLRFLLEPPEEDSPVMSLDAETVDKMATWAQAYESIRGDHPSGAVAGLDDLLQLILQLPEDAVGEVEDLSELADAQAELSEDDEDDDGDDGGEDEDGDDTDADDEGDDAPPPFDDDDEDDDDDDDTDDD